MKKQNSFAGLQVVAALFSIVSISACDGSGPLVAPELRTADFLVGNELKEVEIVEYSLQETLTQIPNKADDPFFAVQGEMPLTGSMVLGFSQLLDGSTVETLIREKITVAGKEQDHMVGEGDYKQKIAVASGFTQVAGVLEVTSPGLDLSRFKYMMSYRPDGGVVADPKKSVTETPPPAIRLDFKEVVKEKNAKGEDVDVEKDTYLPADSVIQINLLVDKTNPAAPKVIKNYEGIEMPASLNKKGVGIKNAAGKAVSASVQFRTAPLMVVSASEVLDPDTNKLVVALKFNSAVKPGNSAQFSVGLADSPDSERAAGVKVSKDLTVLLVTPGRDLVAGSTYRVTATGSITDLYGKPLSIGKRTATFTVSK